MNRERDIDAELILKYQAGQHEVLTDIVKRWHIRFCNRALWIVKDSDKAKDIAQESWKTIITKLHTLEDPGKFSGWAYRIVYSKSLDAIRYSNTLRTRQQQYYKQQESYTVVDENNDSLKFLLINSVKELPIKQQVVVRLFYVEDYKLHEISDLLNISIGTAKSRLFHAREKLKQILKSKSYEN